MNKPLINPALVKLFRLILTVLVYGMSTGMAFLGLIIMAREGKPAEALALAGCTLVLCCKLDQIYEKLAGLHEERLSQYVRKNV